MANREETLETLRLVRAKYPEMLLCLASNGLALPPSLDDLAEINVSHVTVTVNAVDPEIGARIYAWVRDGKVVYRKTAGAELLLKRQMESIRGLHERGIIVKVNMIVTPGVNDHHVEDVAKTVAELGANLLNLMPIHPTRGTVFESVPEPDAGQLTALRAIAEKYLPQMKHCTRCRADAVGLLGEDRSADFRMHLEGCSRAPAPASTSRPYVAVTTQEGVLVNQHLGEAWRFQIWGKNESGSGYKLVAEREAPEPGGGDARWKSMAAILRDCRAVLVSALGDRPAEILTASGIQPVEMNGFIELGLKAIYEGGDPSIFKTRKKGPCGGTGCNSGGGGMGCM
jgi:nitrogen fixation protein NifB